MGISIVQKSDLSKRKLHAKTALVLAGGAISGGAFKAGGLKALSDFLVNFSVTDFDIFVGISAGSFLAAPIAGGIPPEEILSILDGSSETFSQLSPFETFYPAFKKFAETPLKYFYKRISFFPGILVDFFSALPDLSEELKGNMLDFIKNPNYSNYEKVVKPLLKTVYSSRSMPSVISAIPDGIFDNRPLEVYLRENMKRNKLSNHFKVLKRIRGKDLYISAMDLDTAENVVFGWDEKNDILISEAVMASTAMPGFYQPARIKGVDYIDGGVRKTANLDLAIQKGADLILCYNPFRPLRNDVVIDYVREGNRYVSKNRRISDGGMIGVFNQVFRTLYHSRLHYAMQRYQDDPNFKGDIILIEPTEDDDTFFQMNPFGFWNRAKAAKQGFDSVSVSINGRFEEISKILSSYGIEMSQDLISSEEERIRKASNDDSVIMNVLERTKSKKKGFRIIDGGPEQKAKKA